MENKVVYGALAIPYRKSGEKIEYLLLKHQSGMWTFPGGGKDDTDQTLEDCLVREIREEIGLQIDKNTLIPTGLVNKFTYGSEKQSREGMKGETHFWLLPLIGDEELSGWDKIVDHGWFEPEKIVDLLALEDMRQRFLEATRHLV